MWKSTLNFICHIKWSFAWNLIQEILQFRPLIHGCLPTYFKTLHSKYSSLVGDGTVDQFLMQKQNSLAYIKCFWQDFSGAQGNQGRSDRHRIKFDPCQNLYRWNAHESWCGSNRSDQTSNRLPLGTRELKRYGYSQRNGYLNCWNYIISSKLQ